VGDGDVRGVDPDAAPEGRPQGAVDGEVVLAGVLPHGHLHVVDPPRAGGRATAGPTPSPAPRPRGPNLSDGTLGGEI